MDVIGNGKPESVLVGDSGGVLETIKQIGVTINNRTRADSKPAELLPVGLTFIQNVDIFPQKKQLKFDT